MDITSTSPVLRTPPAAPLEAAAYFAAKLAYHTDVADVHTAWAQACIPGAVHLPTAQIPERAPQLLEPGVPVVTYCWGPGCDGASRGALALARLGYRVKEMLGGIEYWIREGFPVETAEGLVQRPTDPLTAPVAPVSCDC
jgi:rhodanese-related sulfurtransferase